ncbi:putative surface protein with fasciclin (FAS1) repeats [Brevundimonas alba]|uniref:Putative surface protein with fasciclin (FAS1) repeats n=1 Tax=Brevundimonas alba TaxID=74314 RepID=A0A7X6BPJ4_9CAUL|nr:fasciclin domain-containing protein [Brevundimonas alba]NJC41571.1 putative surface protein with fasciclin (FAS1) repeats [Brevundimonas alba]
MRTTGTLLAVLACAAILPGCDNREVPKQAAAPSAAPAPAPATTDTVLLVAQRGPDFTTLVSALQTAEVAATLGGGGPFTVFAPTNAAFEKVPAERRDALTKPEGKAELRRLLTYHIVPGRLDAAALAQRIQAAGGSLALTTMQGGTLTAKTNPDGSIGLTDAAGGVARVIEADMVGSNGVIHGLDTVLSPG